MSQKGFETIHLAAQYLAAAGISFIAKKEDDSHTNLGFSTEQNQYFTHPLSDSGDYLALNLNDFSLEWAGPGHHKTALNGKTHEQLLSWIGEASKNAGLSSSYLYKFHYDLPYKISDSFTFTEDGDALRQEIELRSLATKVIGDVLAEHAMTSEIRTWPHHFDTGALGLLPGGEISVGLGLAIPDSLVDDYYFYISAYSGHDAIIPENPSPLTYGKWYTEGFKGGILKASNSAADIAKQFFRESIEAYLR